MDEMTLTITEEDLVHAMMDLITEDDSQIKELVEHQPMLALLFPILGIECWKQLEKQEEHRVVEAAAALFNAMAGGDKEDDK